MPDSIKDGKGSGRLAGVTSENRLSVGAVSVSKEHHSNFEHQDAYNMLFDVTPTGAGDVFLYIKNTDDEPIICEGLNLWAASVEEVTVTIGGTGTPVGGTDTVPTNLTAGSTKIARGVFQTGNDITGLSQGQTAVVFHLAAAGDSKFRNFDADIVIPQNQTLWIAAATGGVALQGFVVMWHDHGGIS